MTTAETPLRTNKWRVAECYDDRRSIWDWEWSEYVHDWLEDCRQGPWGVSGYIRKGIHSHIVRDGEECRDPRCFFQVAKREKEAREAALTSGEWSA